MAWEFVLWADLVEISEIYVTTYLPIFLLYWHDIGQPLQVLDGLDETNGQQVFHFLHYLFFYFGMKQSGRLSHWLSLGIYVECVHYQSRV